MFANSQAKVYEEAIKRLHQLHPNFVTLDGQSNGFPSLNGNQLLDKLNNGNLLGHVHLDDNGFIYQVNCVLSLLNSYNDYLGDLPFSAIKKHNNSLLDGHYLLAKHRSFFLGLFQIDVWYDSFIGKVRNYPLPMAIEGQ